jgi:hypothetical protein
MKRRLIIQQNILNDAILQVNSVIVGIRLFMHPTHTAPLECINTPIIAKAEEARLPASRNDSG